MIDGSSPGAATHPTLILTGSASAVRGKTIHANSAARKIFAIVIGFLPVCSAPLYRGFAVPTLTI
jgi:hypothetical protein